MSWTKSDWERLGDYVTAGRIRVDMSRFDLAAGADLSVRTLADIENGELGKRRAFSAETLEAIGACLRWRPGSWRRVLNGEEPLIDHEAPEVVRPHGPSDVDEPAEMMPAFLAALDKLSPAERQAVLVLVETFAHRDLEDAPRSSHRALLQAGYVPAEELAESPQVSAEDAKKIGETIRRMRNEIAHGRHVDPLTGVDILVLIDGATYDPVAGSGGYLAEAARQGVSAGQRLRRDQDEAGEESQDSGGS